MAASIAQYSNVDDNDNEVINAQDSSSNANKNGQFSRAAHFSFGFINPNFYIDQPSANLLDNVYEDDV